MATGTLRYLQDDQDPLNQLLAAGGNPPVPDAPAPEPQQQPGDEVAANPYRDGLEQSLLSAPAPQPEAAAPMPLNLRDSYAEPGAAAPARGAPKDPELDAAYRNAQMDALQHAKFDDKGYGVGEGLRDNGAALLASILDIGFNKGRGLGGIVGATAQEVGRQADSREKERKAAQDFALAARKQHDDGLGQQRLDYLYASLANKEKSQEGAQGRFDARRGDINDPNSQRNTTAQQQAYLTSLARGQGTQEATHQYNPTIATDRANIAGAEAAASTGARIGTEHDNAPITTQDAADRAAAESGARIQTDLNYAPQTTAAAAQKAGAVSEAQIAPELQKQQAMNPILADRNTNGVGVGLDPSQFAKDNPNLTFDQTQLARALKTRTTGPRFIEQIQAANRAHEITQALNDSIEAFQSIPERVQRGELTLAQANDLRAELSQQIAGHKSEYAGAMGKISGSASQAQIQHDTESLPSEYNPTARDRMKGVWRTIEANIKGNLGTYGVGANPPAFIGGGQQQQPPAAAPAPQPGAPGSGMPDYSHDLNETGLGPPQRVPPRPAGVNAPQPAPGGAGMHHIRNPKTGKVVETMMPPDQLKPALAAGWELVD